MGLIVADCYPVSSWRRIFRTTRGTGCCLILMNNVKSLEAAYLLGCLRQKQQRLLRGSVRRSPRSSEATQLDRKTLLALNKCPESAPS